ncbi:MAG: acetolactate synthase 3 large subunit [Alphaproteobacteria bacterium]|nr:acetolactate synthase 3 large subunit [Alphaproteobacteria bacterium]
MTNERLSGSQLLLKALADQGVDVVFGYPGGVVLPLYDELFKQNRIRHVLVRHEQGAVHAAEGYARSTGKVGVVLVTSGPGATNTVTGLTDALMDSIPIVCLTGQVPTSLIGNDAFQEADITGITRACTKHNYLVKDINRLARTIHEAFYVARSGRPGPVLVDLPKDILTGEGSYVGPELVTHKSYHPVVKGETSSIAKAVEMMAEAKRPLLYCGGGVINSGPAASEALTQFLHMTGFPITLTLMGLGAVPASDGQYLGMVGMHGTYEANLAMHGCDLMIAIGSRFDDRVTGRTNAFSPHSTKIHVDIDPSNINKNVMVDLPIVGDVANVLGEMISLWRARTKRPDRKRLEPWWKQIEEWRGRKCLNYPPSDKLIKPQYAIQRLYELTRNRDTYITTEVGQHQMWAAQHYKFESPKRWMTSGGLGTMGYGLPAAIGVQVAHPESLVVDIAGDSSIMMNIQEVATAVQYHLPVKVFITNNKYMGMVRQWQELLYGGRYSQSHNESQPDFVKLAEAFGAVGLRCDKPDELDATIERMIAANAPVLCEVIVDPSENCFPMIPAGAAHNEMLLGPFKDGIAKSASENDGMVLI